MATIYFELNGVKTTMQCQRNEKMKTICNKYAWKVGKNINNLFFVYNGDTLRGDLMELSFEEKANNIDRERNKMELLVVNESKDIKENEIIIKPKEVICPECKENIRINIKDYKIKLFECKNGHNIDMLFNEFEKTQYIYESKIICDNCFSVNKSNTYENKFFKCNKCKPNLCPLCNNNHDKSHESIDYDIKNYTCEEHNEIYTSYCKTCKKNICTICLEAHNNHDTVLYKLIDINKKKEELKELRTKIDKMK